MNNYFLLHFEHNDEVTIIIILYRATHLWLEALEYAKFKNSFKFQFHGHYDVIDVVSSETFKVLLA